MDADAQRTAVVLVRGRQRVLVDYVDPEGCPLSLVDDLARLRLGAGRFGWAVRLEGACAELTELLDLCGLADVLG